MENQALKKFSTGLLTFLLVYFVSSAEPKLMDQEAFMIIQLVSIIAGTLAIQYLYRH
ncbi:hypothetical protein ACWOE5_07705 [Aerococcus sanguinicola]|uniref:hypothetical protein n=1 Tax=Aerococcus TaxID=1375 RepID=UPI000B0A0DC7|nr:MULTISPECIES: hypothetical protein [Aerococcus]MDK7050581.1 hypothetical protein [Aerococcus sanguinicola]